MGYRLMVGQQFLELLIEVRALVPQQNKELREYILRGTERHLHVFRKGSNTGREVFCFEYSRN
jgi:hypothetical protein